MFAKGGVPSRSGFGAASSTWCPARLHVTGGCIWLIWLVGQIARLRSRYQDEARLYAAALFWHFLDIVGSAIFSRGLSGGLT